MEEHVQQKSWFSRNWVWAVPGCGCLVVILLFIFGIGATIFGVSKFINESSTYEYAAKLMGEPYEYAMSSAKKNPEVFEYLGDSIKVSGLISGNVSLNNDEGTANFTAPIIGSLGSGTLIVVAEKFNKEWVYEDLYVIVNESNKEINLLEKTLEGI